MPKMRNKQAILSKTNFCCKVKHTLYRQVHFYVNHADC